MCECGFCGTNLTRRSHFQDTQHKKPVWKCRTATNKGKANCPHSKSIDEVIVKNAFVEMFNLIAYNFDDVIESVIQSVEETISSDESVVKLNRMDKMLSAWKSKRTKLTDLFLDDKITKEAYDEKMEEFNQKISNAEEEREIYVANANMQRNVSKRMKEIREQIKVTKVLKNFDRTVFESIVEKVIVGEQNQDGISDPYKVTFVLKGINSSSIPDAKNRYKNFHKQKIS